MLKPRTWKVFEGMEEHDPDPLAETSQRGRERERKLELERQREMGLYRV